MMSALSSLHKSLGLATVVFLLVGAAWAQAPNQEAPAPDMPKLRQPKPSSVQQRESQQPTADKATNESDRKVREMDRRMSRTLRSICNGC